MATTQSSSLVRTWQFLCLLALGVAGSGCKSKVGDSCTAGQAACQDAQSELVCEDGKFVAAACKGPAGCKVDGSTMRCDVSANTAADTCAKASEGHASCGSDKKSKVVCTGGKYAVGACRGPDGCKEEGSTVTCDVSISVVGDGCDGSSYACSVDKKSVLQCKGGKFAVHEACKKACGTKGDAVGCDLD